MTVTHGVLSVVVLIGLVVVVSGTLVLFIQQLSLIARNLTSIELWLKHWATMDYSTPERVSKANLRISDHLFRHTDIRMIKEVTLRIYKTSWDQMYSLGLYLLFLLEMVSLFQISSLKNPCNQHHWDHLLLASHVEVILWNNKDNVANFFEVSNWFIDVHFCLWCTSLELVSLAEVLASRTWEVLQYDCISLLSIASYK